MNSIRTGLIFVFAAALVTVIAGCSSSSKSNSTAPTDTTPPAAVVDLAAATPTSRTVVLNWTAPGNDGTTGTAHQYDIRYATSTITDASFSSASPVTGAPDPVAAGNLQTVTVTGLNSSTRYYFAMKTADAVPNWSPLSDVVSDSTLASSTNTVPPGTVGDLAASATTASSVTLGWTAPGSDGTVGTASQYDLRYSTASINDGNFSSATPVAGVPAPTPSGTTQSVTVGNLSANTPYYFALKTADEVPNWSSLSNVVQASTSTPGPTALFFPDFPSDVCISSADAHAQQAKGLVEAQLAYASFAGAFLGPLTSPAWVSSGTGCYSYATSTGACSSVYQACPSGTGTAYTFTLNGSCSGVTYDNWVFYRALLQPDSLKTTFYVYSPNTTNVVSGSLWRWTSDQLTGSFYFYHGDPHASPYYALLQWSRSSDDNTYDLTYTVPSDLRAISHFVKSPCSGTLETDSFDTDFWKQNVITWDSTTGHGSWTVYNENGTVASQNAW